MPKRCQASLSTGVERSSPYTGVIRWHRNRYGLLEGLNSPLQAAKQPLPWVPRAARNYAVMNLLASSSRAPGTIPRAYDLGHGLARADGVIEQGGQSGDRLGLRRRSKLVASSYSKQCGATVLSYFAADRARGLAGEIQRTRVGGSGRGRGRRADW